MAVSVKLKRLSAACQYLYPPASFNMIVSAAADLEMLHMFEKTYIEQCSETYWRPWGFFRLWNFYDCYCDVTWGRIYEDGRSVAKGMPLEQSFMKFCLIVETLLRVTNLRIV
jgi:hypothetical protein